MDYLAIFKQYLLSQIPQPSAVTIKNYQSDVRKFIKWYETNQSYPFIPQNVSKDHFFLFQEWIETQEHFSERSATRYLSSLRKFFLFLNETDVIKHTILTRMSDQTVQDPWNLHQFTLFLKTENASDLTIKNYINDLRQFILWLGKNGEPNTLMHPAMFTFTLPAAAVDEYKLSLFQQKELSPLSINRKLSSIRRYLKWRKANIMIHKLSEFDEKTISNIRKSFYAPQTISLLHLPLHKRLLHNIRHAQPRWNRSYHLVTIENRKTFGLLLFLTIAIGLMIGEHFSRAFFITQKIIMPTPLQETPLAVHSMANDFPNNTLRPRFVITKNGYVITDLPQEVKDGSLSTHQTTIAAQKEDLSSDTLSQATVFVLYHTPLDGKQLMQSDENDGTIFYVRNDPITVMGPGDTPPLQQRFDAAVGAKK